MAKATRRITAVAVAAAAAALLTLTTTGTAFAEVGAPSFGEGAQGFNVFCAQTAMWDNSQGNSATPDGSFGPQTLASVLVYQDDFGLKADGEVGPKTGTAMWNTIAFNIKYFGGDYGTPWGVPISHCYQVLPTTS
jgi:peptidoglycan hydrolase-like protein with peptidoglycan-binding domain